MLSALPPSCGSVGRAGHHASGLECLATPEMSFKKQLDKQQ